MSTKIQTFVPFLLASFSSVTLHRTTYRTTSISFDMPWNRSIFSGHIIGTAYAVPIIKLRLAAQAFYREFLTELPIRYITGTPSQPHKSVNKKARCVNRTSSLYKADTRSPFSCMFVNRFPHCRSVLIQSIFFGYNPAFRDPRHTDDINN